MGPVVTEKEGTHIPLPYGNLPVVKLYGFTPARE